jgi:hypothetical protein
MRRTQRARSIDFLGAGPPRRLESMLRFHRPTSMVSRLAAPLCLQHREPAQVIEIAALRCHRLLEPVTSKNTSEQGDFRSHCPLGAHLFLDLPEALSALWLAVTNLGAPFDWPTAARPLVPASRRSAQRRPGSQLAQRLERDPLD